MCFRAFFWSFVKSHGTHPPYTLRKRIVEMLTLMKLDFGRPLEPIFYGFTPILEFFWPLIYLNTWQCCIPKLCSRSSENLASFVRNLKRWGIAVVTSPSDMTVLASQEPNSVVWAGSHQSPSLSPALRSCPLRSVHQPWKQKFSLYLTVPRIFRYRKEMIYIFSFFFCMYLPYHRG